MISILVILNYITVIQPKDLTENYRLTDNVRHHCSKLYDPPDYRDIFSRPSNFIFNSHSHVIVKIFYNNRLNLTDYSNLLYNSTIYEKT